VGVLALAQIARVVSSRAAGPGPSGGSARSRGGRARFSACDPGLPCRGWVDRMAVGRFRMRGIVVGVGALCAAFALSGCASSKMKERVAVLDAENTDLRQQTEQLNGQLQQTQSESDR